MRYCEKCGSEIIPGSKFCIECGAEIHDEEDQELGEVTKWVDSLIKEAKQKQEEEKAKIIVEEKKPDIYCPECGSIDCVAIGQAKISPKKSLYVYKHICGSTLLGPLSIPFSKIFGNEKKKLIMEWLCKDCGNRFDYIDD